MFYICVNNEKWCYKKTLAALPASWLSWFLKQVSEIGNTHGLGEMDYTGGKC